MRTMHLKFLKALDIAPSDFTIAPLGMAEAAEAQKRKAEPSTSLATVTQAVKKKTVGVRQTITSRLAAALAKQLSLLKELEPHRPWGTAKPQHLAESVEVAAHVKYPWAAAATHSAQIDSMRKRYRAGLKNITLALEGATAAGTVSTLARKMLKYRPGVEKVIGSIAPNEVVRAMRKPELLTAL